MAEVSFESFIKAVEKIYKNCENPLGCIDMCSTYSIQIGYVAKKLGFKVEMIEAVVETSFEDDGELIPKKRFEHNLLKVNGTFLDVTIRQFHDKEKFVSTFTDKNMPAYYKKVKSIKDIWEKKAWKEEVSEETSNLDSIIYTYYNFSYPFVLLLAEFDLIKFDNSKFHNDCVYQINQLKDKFVVIDTKKNKNKEFYKVLAGK